MTHFIWFINVFSLQAASSLQVWSQLVRASVVSFVPRYSYFHPLALQSRAGSQILQRTRHAGMPSRLWAVHRLQTAKPGYDSKVYGAENQMAAIKPFIFYVLVSWLSCCRGRRDTGPTSQKPRRNYSIWIIHHTWGRYLFKGTDVSLLPSHTVKLKVAQRHNVWTHEWF